MMDQTVVEVGVAAVALVIGWLGYKVKVRRVLQTMQDALEVADHVLEDARMVVKEMKDVVVAYNRALEDASITEEEMKRIAREVKEAIEKLEDILHSVR